MLVKCQVDDISEKSLRHKEQLILNAMIDPRRKKYSSEMVGEVNAREGIQLQEDTQKNVFISRKQQEI